MKHFLLILICLLTVRNYHAQIECFTDSPQIDSLSIIPSTAKAPPLNNATIRIFLHIIRNSNGGDNNSITLSNAIAGYNAVSQHFNMHSICFGLVGWDYIDNSSYYNNFNSSKVWFLFQENVHADAIDVYIIPSWQESNQTINGLANGIPSKSIIITKEAMNNGATLSHEIGHCLGLYHTFETSFCVENINQSNCQSCGDKICDTPADPGGNNVGPNCNYIGGGGL